MPNPALYEQRNNNSLNLLRKGLSGIIGKGLGSLLVIGIVLLVKEDYEAEQASNFFVFQTVLLLSSLVYKKGYDLFLIREYSNGFSVHQYKKLSIKPVVLCLKSIALAVLPCTLFFPFDISIVLILGMFVGGATASIALSTACYYANGKVAVANMMQLVVLPFLVLLSLVISNVTIIQLILLYGIISLAVGVVAFLMSIKFYSSNVGNQKIEIDSNEVNSVMIVNIVASLTSWLPQLLIVAFGNKALAVDYTVIVRLIGPVSMLIQSLSSSFAQDLVCCQKNLCATVKKLSGRICLFTFVISILYLSILIIVLFLWDLVKLSDEAETMLIVLVVGSVANSLTGCSGYFLNLNGNANITKYYSISSLLVQLMVFVFLWILSLLEYVYILYSFSLVFQNVCLLAFIKKKYKFWFLPRFA